MKVSSVSLLVAGFVLLSGFPAVISTDSDQTTSAQTCTLPVQTDDVQPEETVDIPVVSLLNDLRRSVFKMQSQNPLIQSLKSNLTEIRTIMKQTASSSASSSSSSSDNNDKQELLENKVRALQRWFGRFTIHHGVFSLFFKDLNNIIFRYSDDDLTRYEWTDRQTRLADFINEHTREDGTHFRFAIADFRRLGLDNPPLPYSETVLFWYGDEMEASRIAGYELIKIDARFGGDMDPLYRYVLIEVTEFTGEYIFTLLATLYDEFHQAIDDLILFFSQDTSDSEERLKSMKEVKERCTLMYSGSEHSAQEIGDLYVEKESHHSFLDGFNVSLSQSENLTRMGNQVMSAIHGLWVGSHQFSKSSEGPKWTQF